MKAIKTQIQFTYEWKQREEIYGKRLGFRRAKKAETEYKHKIKLNNK